MARRESEVRRRLRKEVNQRLRRLRKRVAETQHAVRALWLRFPDEATECPACGSSALALLDRLRVRADLTGRRLAFLTGCEACGLLFTNPVPPPERAAASYAAGGRWGEAHAERAGYLAAAHHSHVASNKPPVRDRPGRRSALLDAWAPYVPVASPPPGSKAVDFGCGEGKLLNSLQDAGWDTYGLEPSTDVAFLRHRRLDTLPADGRFDLAILHHVLEHVPNPLAVLREIAASLKDGGVLFISVPRIDRLGQHGDFHYCINGRNHLVAFTEPCLRNLLARAGFDVLALLDAPELDRALTHGLPLRLRVMARRTSAPTPPPPAPLRAARTALSAYRRQLALSREVTSVLPVRLRAGWTQWKLTR